MKKILILFVILFTASALLIVSCSKKEYEHTNLFDPLNPNATTPGEDPPPSEPPPSGPYIGTIAFDQSSYTGTNDTATITVTDGDLSAASININVKSTSDGTGISLTLNKSGSTYTGTVDFSLNTSSTLNSKIEANDGDTITATYADANPSADRMDTATFSTQQTILNNWYVYEDGLTNGQATGFMGTANGASLTIDLASADSPQSGATCWKIDSNGTEGWAGIYIQFTGNWRVDQPGGPFADLSEYNALVFWARVASGSKTIDQMGMGDLSGVGDSSGQIKLAAQNITTTWQKFIIDLSVADLTSINGLFYFSENGGVYTLYFDHIHYTNQ